MGFLIGMKRTPSRDDVRRDTRGPRPNNLGAFEASYIDELRDHEFWPRQDFFKPEVPSFIRKWGGAPFSYQ